MNYDTEIQIHKDAIGSKTKLQESLLEAVQILHDGFIDNEKIPKTLECKIYDDSKKNEGIYIVDYMNNKFEVSCFLDETFNVNDIVCVLVPDGDFAKTKIIIGSSDGSGEGANWVTQEQLNQAVTTLQTNFQAGVDAVGAACTRKGSPPASHSLEDTVAAIDAIQTGGNYGTLEVSFGPEGTIYNAEDYPGIDAWNIVRVVPPEAPFTVKFFDDDGQTILKTDVNVPYKGSTSCTLLDGTIKNGLYFKGWNPSPTAVTENMNCYPMRGDYIIDPGDIQDSWETICADNGAHYPLGSYKALVFSVPAEIFNFEMESSNGVKKNYSASINAYNVAMRMVKVGEGEDGTTSSWLSTGVIYLDGTYIETSSILLTPQFPTNGDFAKTRTDWGNLPLTKYLDTMFLGHFPQSLQDTIKQVNKSYIGVSSYGDGWLSRVEKTMLNKVWVPSTKELYTYFSVRTWAGSTIGGNALAWGDIDTVVESQGIDYSAVYVPTYSAGNGDNNIMFRSLLPSYHSRWGTYYQEYIGTYSEIQASNYRSCGRNRYFPFGFCL